MTKEEFIKNYCNPNDLVDYKQITWDLCSYIEDVLSDEYILENTAIGSCIYSLETLLEVMREDLPDYQFLKNMYKELEEWYFVKFNEGFRNKAN